MTFNYEEAKQYWEKKNEEAIHNMSVKTGNMELIEVAAQHPLEPDGTPGKEFSKRLDRATELYDKLMAQGCDVRIYIPGSVHCYEGKQDKCSLSASGKKYLMDKGIPEENLIGEGANSKYKGTLGVYNTADECFVASEIFNNGDYRRLHSVCSPNQLMRKKLFYMAFGVIPYFYTVSIDNLAHNDIYEIFNAIPDVLFVDHTWQSEDSENGRRTREERTPREGLNE